VEEKEKEEEDCSLEDDGRKRKDRLGVTLLVSLSFSPLPIGDLPCYRCYNISINYSIL